MNHRVFIAVFALLLPLCGIDAQVKVVLSDSITQEPLPQAVVRLMDNSLKPVGGAVTDMLGHAVLRVPASGKYTVRVSLVGYGSPSHNVWVHLPDTAVLHIRMVEKVGRLEELVVTAKESRGITSVSKIGQEAMQHLQPSSFSDLLELLPGGLAKNPSLLTPNSIRLREAVLPPAASGVWLPRVDQSNYATAAMGTKFLIDGMPIGQDAGMSVVGSVGVAGYDRAVFVNQGVDMRTLSTDDVESVEIVRGIPSVEYSDLTSGLVKIHRKRDLTQWQARVKSDMSSNLVHLARGVDFIPDRLNLSVGGDWLAAHADPRDVRQSYKRITGSARLTYKQPLKNGRLQSLSSVDFTSSVDDTKKDPDQDMLLEDSYQASFFRYSLAHSLIYDRGKPTGWQQGRLDASVSGVKETTQITRGMQLLRDIPYTTSLVEGSHEAQYYPLRYLAHHLVEGRPHYIHLKGKGEYRWKQHRLTVGAGWDWSKNQGRGEVYDLDHPVFTTASARPRPYKDVPAKSRVNLFMEDAVDFTFGNCLFSLHAGVLGNMLLGLPQSYTMQGRIYPDIRLNARLHFPPVKLAGTPLNIQLLAGYGSLSLFPTMLQLFPKPLYQDYVELNFYHPNPEYRRVQMRTYIYDLTNYNLQPAHNHKWELRLDMDWKHYAASLTLFTERMNDGFRYATAVNTNTFTRYITAGIAYDKVTAKPELDYFRSVTDREFVLRTQTTNGSATYKTGVEWTANTPRYKWGNTRITYSGAWFSTVYKNSQPQYVRPSVVLGDKQIPYVGKYMDNEELHQEVLNSDLRADSYIPYWGLGVSVSVQTNWYSASQKKPISAYPNSFVDLQEQEHPYTTESAADPALQWLKREVNPSDFVRYTLPSSTAINLKATKMLWGERMRVALFVNKLFDYSPDIHRNGFVIRRNQYPYFGMELNLKL